MRRRGAGVAILIGGATLFLAAPASAGTLDQEQAQFGGVAHGIYADNGMGSGEQSVAQTFTAGLTGELDQVDLYLQKFGAPVADLTVEIWDTVAGTPVNVLATESVSPAAVAASPNYSFVPVTFDPTVPVTAGTQYAIVAWTAAPHGPQYSWGEQNGNPYAAGELRVQLGPTASPPQPGFWGPGGATVDMTFKTYVLSSSGGPPPATPPSTTPAASETGQRAAALAKCKKKRKKLDWSKKRYKKCKRQANRLPV